MQSITRGRIGKRTFIINWLGIGCCSHRPLHFFIPSASKAIPRRRGIDWSHGLAAIPMLAATALSRLSKVQNWHRSIAAAASR